MLKKLYDKSEMIFTLVWIGIYCVLMSVGDALSALVGVEKSLSLLVGIGLSAVLARFLQRHGLLGVYGLRALPLRKRDQQATEVVAALIWDEGKFMICQRPAHKARGLLWEFVGGKVEPGETKEQALIRECREELAVTLNVGEVFMDVVHKYPDLTVHLTLYNAVIAEGVPVLLEHHDLRWITPAEIGDYAFCPADEEILARIRQG